MDQTCAQRGLTPYGKIVQKHDYESQLRVELQQRGFDAWKHGANYVDAKGNAKPNKKKTFSELKEALKSNEIARVTNDGGDEEAIGWASKGFKILSGAKFEPKEKVCCCCYCYHTLVSQNDCFVVECPPRSRLFAHSFTGKLARYRYRHRYLISKPCMEAVITNKFVLAAFKQGLLVVAMAMVSGLF